MSFQTPIDATQPLGQVRYLIGDIDPNNAQWQDEAITTFVTLSPFNSIFLAAAMALDGLASMAAANCENVKLGYFAQQDGDKAEALREVAQRFRDWEYNTPAWAVVEENLSGMNELKIIRNFILRTET